MDAVVVVTVDELGGLADGVWVPAMVDGVQVQVLVRLAADDDQRRRMLGVPPG